MEYKLIDPKIYKDHVMVITSIITFIIFFIVTIILIYMIYGDKIIIFK